MPLTKQDRQRAETPMIAFTALAMGLIDLGHEPAVVLAAMDVMAGNLRAKFVARERRLTKRSRKRPRRKR